MNKKKSTGISESTVYKIAAVGIFALLIVFIVMIAVSTARDDGGAYITEAPDNTKGAQQVMGTGTDTAPTSVHAPVTNETTQKPETTEKPVTDNRDTTPVASPTGHSPKDWADFLKGFSGTVLAETPDAGLDYIDKLIFLGDSTTYGLIPYKMLKGGRDTKQVWTPVSGTLTLNQVSFATIVYPDTGEQITIADAIAKKKPEYLVITLGVNGISFMYEKEDYFKSEYKWVIDTVKKLSPDTKIICQSIFPVARSYDKLGSINNEKIMIANRWIVELAKETGVKFLDTYSVLCDSEGWLPENYHNGDGMHLNSTSFAIELANLRTHAYK